MTLLDPSGRPIASTTAAPDLDDVLLARVVDEIAGLETFSVAIEPGYLFGVVALVQLALRHLQVRGNNRFFGDHFVDIAREYFADCPAVLEAIRRGDDVAYDVSDDG